MVVKIKTEIEIIAHSYYKGGSWHVVPEKRYYGTINNGKIKGFYISRDTHEAEQSSPSGYIKCYHPSGHYPITTATLSQNGNSLYLKATVPATNYACRPLVFSTHLIRE